MNWLSLIVLSFMAWNLSAQTALHGLYTPIQLQPQETTIYLRDYLVDAKATKIDLPKGLYQLNSGVDTLILAGKMNQKMDVLTIHIGDEKQHLVLINPSARRVNITVSAQALYGKEVRLIGAFNNWNRGSEVLKPGKGTYSAAYTLEPGRYEYKFFVDGKEMLDPSNPDSVSNGMGGYNNILEVKAENDVKTEPFTIEYRKDTLFDPDDWNIIFGIDYNISTTTQTDRNNYVALWQNQKITAERPISVYAKHFSFSIPEKAKEIKRSYIRIYSFAGSDKGRDQLIPLEYGVPVSNTEQLERSDWHQARMYFLMVDRFHNGDTDNDLPTPDESIQPIANYMGGDLAGVNQKIEANFFTDLGANTIWLSPITQNPYDAWGLWNKGKVHSTFSGYHGYWPISNKQVDTRFGKAHTVETLLDKAHGQDQNVILDYVANHVHIDHPIYKEHKDWATNLYLPDSSKNTEKWDEHRLTTWFDDHLPTLDLRRYEVVDPMADSALYWVDRYDFDGFRHDATKHIDELYWRTLTYRVKQKTNKPIYQIGETYGSPQLINSYISTGMLDAQFDFNLYDAAVSTFAFEGSSLDNLINKTRQGLDTYGYHHLMGNITGNQDRVRFISLAGGDVKASDDVKLIGWDTEIGKPKADAYKRLALIHAFNNAVPGIPCIYYGDEYGMPGAGDPDNRRMMEFEDYDADEQALLQNVKQLNQLRASQLALIYGATYIEALTDEVLLIKRVYFDEEVLILINTSTEAQSIDTTYWKNNYSPQFNPSSTSDLKISLPALSFEYLLKSTQP